MTCSPFSWTQLMTALAPVRPSCGPMPVLPSTSTQRIRPSATACWSHSTLTSDSRPEKPPMPATLAPESMIAEAAPVWLETPIVPPPLDRT